MKRRIEGTESSIENSTSKVYGIQTSTAAHAAFRRMKRGATPVCELARERSMRPPALMCISRSAAHASSASPYLQSDATMLTQI
jgi:hypothetical protein